FTKQECPESNALADGADNNVAGRLHEHDFEQGQDVAGTVISRTDKKKPLASHKSPLAAPNQKLVQSGKATQIGGRGIDGNGSKLERISDGVVRQKCKD